MRTVLVNVGDLAHLSGADSLTGKGMIDENSLIAKGMGIIIESGQIVKIQESEELIDEYGTPSLEIGNLSKFKQNETNVIYLGGRAIIPGLVDSHSHLIWAGDRSKEVRWKLQGKTYSEIASMGGGIISTVNETRKASSQSLLELASGRLKEAFRSGTTHIESKSGYGLDTETELRILEVSN